MIDAVALAEDAAVAGLHDDDLLPTRSSRRLPLSSLTLTTWGGGAFGVPNVCCWTGGCFGSTFGCGWTVFGSGDFGASLGGGWTVFGSGTGASLGWRLDRLRLLRASLGGG